MEVKTLTMQALKCVGGWAVVSIQRFEQPARRAARDAHLVDNVRQQKTFPLIVFAAEFRDAHGF